MPRMHEILGALSPAQVAAMQRALACHTRHLWWSTMWGAIWGEDGRYDAFATLMEVLGARLRHPDAKPEVRGGRWCWQRVRHGRRSLMGTQHHGVTCSLRCSLQDLIRVDERFAKFARCELGGACINVGREGCGD